jgi:hypothetical protein
MCPKAGCCICGDELAVFVITVLSRMRSGILSWPTYFLRKRNRMQDNTHFASDIGKVKFVLVPN